MDGVPAHFASQTDRADFKALAGVPEVELYQAHIDRHSFDPHTHQAFGIGLIDHGAQRFRYRGANHLAGSGALVLMNPDELHTGQSASEHGWHYRMIYLPPALVEHLGGAPDWHFGEVLQSHPGSTRRLSALLGALWQNSDALATHSLLLDLVALCAPFAKSRPAAPEGRHDFSKVTALLHSDYHRPLRLEELAQQAGLSPYHFLRQFKRQCHVTPQQMLMAIRLYRAKCLLAKGQPLALVAAAVGLTDQAHLTRAFTSRYGTTPGRYRQQVLGR